MSLLEWENRSIAATTLLADTVGEELAAQVLLRDAIKSGASDDTLLELRRNTQARGRATDVAFGEWCNEVRP